MAPKSKGRKGYAIQLSDQDQKLLALLAETHELTKQDVMRYSIDMFHAHVTRARLDFPGL